MFPTADSEMGSGLLVMGFGIRTSDPGKLLIWEEKSYEDLFGRVFSAEGKYEFGTRNPAKIYSGTFAQLNLKYGVSGFLFYVYVK